jgi:hypothetical protein
MGVRAAVFACRNRRLDTRSIQHALVFHPSLKFCQGQVSAEFDSIGFCGSLEDIKPSLVFGQVVTSCARCAISTVGSEKIPFCHGSISKGLLRLFYRVALYLQKRNNEWRLSVGFFKTSGRSSTDLLIGKEAFQQAIAKERSRSDRSNHKYSLLIISLAIKSDEDKRIGRAIAMIRQRIRAIDEIGWYEENQLGIILPFTTMAGADRLAGEIIAIITAHLAPAECLACELFCYDPETVPEAGMPVWKKNLKG